MLSLMQFFAVTVVCSTGLLAGLVLRHMAGEEMEAGRFYFQKAQLAVPAILLVASAATGRVLPFILSGALLLVMLHRDIGSSPLYLFLGLLLGSSVFTEPLLLITSAVVFIGGLVHASRGGHITAAAFTLLISAHAIYFASPWLKSVPVLVAGML